MPLSTLVRKSKKKNHRHIANIERYRWLHRKFLASLTLSALSAPSIVPYAPLWPSPSLSVFLYASPLCPSLHSLPLSAHPFPSLSLCPSLSFSMLLFLSMSPVSLCSCPCVMTYLPINARLCPPIRMLTTLIREKLYLVIQAVSNKMHIPYLPLHFQKIA